MQLSWSFYPALLSNSMVFFIVQFSAFVIVPFQSLMVTTFLSPNVSRSQLGEETSCLGSVFFLGYILGCLGLTFLADRFGRRPVLLLAIFGNTACLILFGFSFSFAWAVISRIVCGAFGGIIAVARTYNAECYSTESFMSSQPLDTSSLLDEKTQAAGFAMIGTMSIMGRTSGIFFGDFLSQPAIKYYQLSKVLLFHRFKFLLPCLVGSSFGMFNLICGWLFLKETQATKKSVEISASRDEEEANRTSKRQIWFYCYVIKKRNQLRRIFKPLLQLKIIVSMFLFGLTPFALVPSTKVVSLLPRNSMILEGIYLDSTVLGIIVVSSSVIVSISQVFLYLLITKYIGYLWTFRLTSLFFATFLFVIPFTSRLMGPLIEKLQNDTNNDFTNSTQDFNSTSTNANMQKGLWLIWLVIGILQSAQTLLRVLYITGTLALFGSATKAESRSLINGIGQSFCGISSIIVPFVSEPLHKWSKHNGLPWPLNDNFPFEVVAVFVLSTGALSFLLQASVDGNKDVSKSKSARSSPDQSSLESYSFLSSIHTSSDSSDVG